ncbi:uncharacterized protein FPRO_02400 [Fusarium proliferatum ET1]|uniref:DUF6604 domain-containing protein n=1 Tax=Fusarium proliferatum (strain ET1) TaxID=1227346 RepID=A0A1L7VD27_FUSPR|nr:uncharacterized protein FPRO_02400 [Fusarium proliferatum ET1]CZR37340.1 uncharacterized protein FPRO_02400 [Fusarium proliferatum ET1]
MLSPAYMSIYQQYKADTDSVATWLANTAKAHGYEAEASHGGASADAAKKKKKKRGNGNGKGPIRRWFSQKLANSGAKRHHRSDATHSHFVEALEKVRGYVKPIMEAGLFKPDDLDKKTDVKTNHPAKGMFDVLNVYTPSEELLNAPDITPTPEPETQYTVEEEVTWEDAFFAFAALLRDYDYLSQEIHSLWKKYASGELDLAAVALATNTAFEFAHSMEADIKKLMDELVRGMGAALRETKNYPRLWISWALQMYLDIVQGLGESVGRGYEQFKKESLKIQKALVDLPKTTERKQVLQVATRWNHDPIFDMSQANAEMGLAAHDSEESSEFHFLRRNPIHCGLLIHHMRSMLHANGVKTAVHSGGLMTTTQLYQALRQESRIPEGQAWEDLEGLWGYQGNPCFFIGNPPTDLEGYYKNYCLCLVTSLTN